VLGELRAGFAVGSQGSRNEAVLRSFLLKPGIGVLYPDEQTTHHYGAVYRQLRKQGTPIPTNDMWIAALVLQHSLVLFARDAHFDALPQLPRA
jgi:tRNA(fMet)-specific endonuclease VapC